MPHAEQMVTSDEQEAVRVALRTQRTQLQRVLACHEQERGEVAGRLLELAAEVLGEQALAAGQLAELLHELGVLAERLHPSLLDDLGLPTALEQLADTAAARELRPVTVAADARLRDLDPVVALALHRVAEDLLAATQGPLRLRVWRTSPGWVQLVAVAGAAGVSGHVVDASRLALAHAHAELLGGMLRASTPRAGGILLHVELPVAG